MGSGERSCNDRVNWFFKVLFGTVAVVGLILVLLVATLDMTSSDRGTTKTTATTSSATPDQLLAGNSMEHADHGTVLGRDDRKLVHPEFDLNYMSKRRVPNGPDPIHNRRAGNSGRPPGQS